MANPLDWSLIREAQKRAEIEIIETIKALVEINVGSNGETFGTEHMSREDRILAFQDDWESGAVECLYTINPEFAERYIRAYQRDMEAMPVMTGNVPDMEAAMVAEGVY